MKKLIITLTGCMIGSFCTWGSTKIAASVQELNAYATTAVAGDSVLLKAGIYKDAIVRFANANGTEQAPVVIAAEVAGKVFFEGTSRLGFSGEYLVVSGFVWQNGGALGTKSVIEFRSDKMHLANHCTLSDCTINSYNCADKTIDNKWVYVYGTHNTIARCLFKDKDNKGPTLTIWLENGVAAHHVIEQNYFLGRKNNTDLDNGFETLRIGLGATSMTDAYCVVRENRFEDCDGEVETISNKAGRNSFLNNTFYNCDGGLTLRHGNNCLVQGNYFFGTPQKRSYGVRIIGEGHRVQYNYCYGLDGVKDKFRAPLTLVNAFPNPELNSYFQVKRAVIANNTFINCASPVFRIGAGKTGATEVPDSCVFVNNLVCHMTATAANNKVIDYITQPTHTFMKNNYYQLPAKLDEPGWELLKGELEVADKLYYLPASKFKGDAAFAEGDIDATGNKLKKGTRGVGAITGNAKMITRPLQSNEVGPLWLR
jgi:poly(beta-D-mannuronate) lyase